MNQCISLLMILLFSFRPASSTWANVKNSSPDSTAGKVKVDSVTLLDKARNRPIPLLLYRSEIRQPLKVALLSHGYGGSYKAYSFIASNLVAHGYLVASIQHELLTDEPLPMTGNPYEVRMPNWKRGVENIHFVIEQLRRQYPAFDFNQVLLVGHSNGGDISMLFAHQYPTRVDKVISLDNRRMPLPRVEKPRILSIRSSDQLADPGVLPTTEEQKRLGIRIVKLPATLHNDMWDGASASQQQEINQIITAFIR